MGRAYALDIHELREFDGGSFLGYYSRGHHAVDVFMQAIAEYCGDEKSYAAPSTTNVKHAYWRTVPAEPTTGEKGSLFVEARGPGRGAYPVTVVETW